MAMDQNPTAVAQYLESMLVATYSNSQKSSQSLQSRSSLLDVSLIPFPSEEDGKRSIALLDPFNGVVYLIKQFL